MAKVQRRDKSQPEIAFHHGDFTLANGSYYPGNADLPWPIEVQQIARKGYCARRSQLILLTAAGVSNEGPRSRVLVPLPAVSWPWVSAWGSLTAGR